MQYEEMNEKRLDVDRFFLKIQYDNLKMERQIFLVEPEFMKEEIKRNEKMMIRLDKEITRIDEILYTFHLPLFAKKAEEGNV